MSLDFSLDVHMSSYNKLKEELSIYEMYTLLMAGKKNLFLCIALSLWILYILFHDCFSCSPIERRHDGCFSMESTCTELRRRPLHGNGQPCSSCLSFCWHDMPHIWRYTFSTLLPSTYYIPSSSLHVPPSLSYTAIHFRFQKNWHFKDPHYANGMPIQSYQRLLLYKIGTYYRLYHKISTK